MVYDLEKIKQKADPNHQEQCNVKLPLRLIVALDKLSEIEAHINPDEPKKPRRLYIAEAVEAYISTSPLKDQVEIETAMHFAHRQNYADRAEEYRLDSEPS